MLRDIILKHANEHLDGEIRPGRYRRTRRFGILQFRHILPGRIEFFEAYSDGYAVGMTKKSEEPTAFIQERLPL